MSTRTQGLKDFLCFVKREWDSFVVRESKAFVLKKKSKLLRDKLRWWNIEVFEWMDIKVEVAVKDLNILYNKTIPSDNNCLKVWRVKRRKASNQVWDITHLSEVFLDKSLEIGGSEKGTGMLGTSKRL